MRRIAISGPEVFRLVVFLFLFIASFALIAYGLRDELLAMIVWVGKTIQEAPVWGAVIFFFASAGSVLFLFLSSVLLVPSAVLVWGKWLTFLLLSVGWLFGWMATYAIGRFFRDQAFIEKKLNGERFNNPAFLSGDLPFSFVLIVICSLPAELSGYALGAARYPFRSFLLALALVEIPFAFLIVFIGESFLRENVGLFIGLMVLLLGIFIWEVKNARRMRRHP
jgi:uncharacterized membrane protein YdjX (TVP38/TMEM64 family)